MQPVGVPFPPHLFTALVPVNACGPPPIHSESAAVAVIPPVQRVSTV